MRYLKVIKSIEIIYGREKEGEKNLAIKKYSDFDWIGNHTTRKSTFGFVFMLNRDSVSWFTKKQAIIALLLTKAKYIALTLVKRKQSS